MICKNCGTENGNRNVCSKCGAFVYQKATQREKDPQVLKAMRRAKWKATFKSIFMSILVVLGAFIVLTLIMWAFFRFVVSKMEWPTEEELKEEMASFEAENATAESTGPITYRFTEHSGL